MEDIHMPAFSLFAYFTTLTLKSDIDFLRDNQLSIRYNRFNYTEK